MIDTLTTCQLENRIGDIGYSYQASQAIASHLEELENEMDEQHEFDTVEIRICFTEFKNAREVVSEYGEYYGFQATEEEEAKELLEKMEFYFFAPLENGGYVIEHE